MGLVDGKNIVMYRDAKDCTDKIRCYLDNDEKRLKIASTGKEFVAKKYTMKKLLKQILENDKLL